MRGRHITRRLNSAKGWLDDITRGRVKRDLVYLLFRADTTDLLTVCKTDDVFDATGGREMHDGVWVWLGRIKGGLFQEDTRMGRYSHGEGP
jgi:hypothetical protein